MKKIIILSLLLMAILSVAVYAQKPGAFDQRRNWYIATDSVLIDSTTSDTSATITIAWYKTAQMVWYMRKGNVLGGDSLLLQIYVDYSMNGTDWKTLDSLDANGSTASADSSVWTVKALSTNGQLYPYMRIITAGRADNDRSGGTSFKWKMFLAE